MVRPKKDAYLTKEPKDLGRAVKKIDWDLVDLLLEAGCNGPQIAPHFDMHPHTFYDRVLKEKGTNFTDYAQQKKCKGDSKLLSTQYLKALGESEKGDNTLLIFLGKVRLMQKENQDNPINVEVTNNFESIMKHYRDQQERSNSTAKLEWNS